MSDIPTDGINKEHFREWVAALRSGKYKQGRDFLCKDDRFCCLGVACELAKAPYKVIKENVRAYGVHGVTGLLPNKAQQWLGLFSDSPTAGYGESSNELTAHNDDGLTFDQIADLIEQTYLPEDAAAREAK